MTGALSQPSAGIYMFALCQSCANWIDQEWKLGSDGIAGHRKGDVMRKSDVFSVSCRMCGGEIGYSPEGEPERQDDQQGPRRL